MLLTTACGSAPDSASQELLPNVVSLPGLDLEPQDGIDALEVVADPAGTLHTVWREAIGGDGRRSVRLRYARGTAGGERWSAPQELAVEAGGPLRLVSDGEGVVLLAGPRLGRWVMAEGGGPWRRLPALLVDDALGFDAVVADGLLTVVYFARRGSGEIVLSQVAAPLEGESVPPRTLVTFPASAFDPPPPRLLAAGGRFMLLAAFNGEERQTVVEGGTSSEVITSKAQVVYLESGDGGGSWSTVEGLPPAGDGPPPFVAAVELVADPPASGAGGPIALYAAFGVYASRRGADGFSPPQPVAVPRSGVLPGGTGAHSLTAAAGAVAWVDERFRQSDRRWWSPLGGFPWSDAPEWRNNDLFTLSASALARALDGGAVTPQRQTAAGSFTRTARLVATGEGLHLLWAGRRRVGKDLDTFGAPPEIFHRAVPPPL